MIISCQVTTEATFDFDAELPDGTDLETEETQEAIKKQVREYLQMEYGTMFYDFRPSVYVNILGERVKPEPTR